MPRRRWSCLDLTLSVTVTVTPHPGDTWIFELWRYLIRLRPLQGGFSLVSNFLSNFPHERNCLSSLRGILGVPYLENNRAKNLFLHPVLTTFDGRTVVQCIAHCAQRSVPH